MMRTWLLAPVLLAGCAGTDFVAEAVPAYALTAPLVVEPRYAAAPDWNDYLLNGEPRAPRYDQADAACDPEALGFRFRRYHDCLHGGELRWAEVQGPPACDGLELRDSAGAFDWICGEREGRLGFHGILKQGGGLGDLLRDSGGFAPLRVTLWYRGELLGRSAPAVWWANPVAPLPDNSGASDPAVHLGEAGHIYVFDGDRETRGLVIDADRVAVVGLSGTLLLRSAAEEGWSAGLINVDAVNQVWIEGAFRRAPAGAVVSTRDAYLPQVRRARLRSEAGAGIVLNSTFGARVIDTDVRSDSIGVEAVNGTWGGGGLYVCDTTIVTSASAGVLTDLGVSNNTIVRTRVHGASTGVRTRGGLTRVAQTIVSGALTTAFSDGNAGNSFIGLGLLAVGGGGSGVEFGDSYQELRHSAVLGHLGPGLYVRGGGAAVEDLLLVNNAVGLQTDGAGVESTFADLVVARNDTQIALSARERFTGALYVGAEGLACAVVDAEAPGLVDGSCANAGGSDAELHLGVDTSAVLVGKVNTDASNTTPGVAMSASARADAVTDWFGFDRAWRAWGLEGSASPFAADQRGPCAGDAACRVFDLSLRATDSVARQRHPPLVDGAPCPAAVHGDEVDAVWQGVHARALKHAYEILGDHLGDDDGFCNSFEACVYAPNLGPYQGHGDDRRLRCAFQDGIVAGVIMYGYPEIGYE